MTLIIEFDLDSVKMNHHAKYLDRRLFSSIFFSRTHTHTPNPLLYLDHKRSQ